MVYKGVIFIHFPWLKIAAGWLASDHHPQGPFGARGAYLDQCSLWFRGGLVPWHCQQMRHTQHSLFDVICGSTCPVQKVGPGRSLLLARSTFWFHVFTVSIRLYPSKSPSFYDHLSMCRVLSQIFFVGFHHHPAERVVTLHFLVRREAPRSPWEVFQPWSWWHRRVYPIMIISYPIQAPQIPYWYPIQAP